MSIERKVIGEPRKYRGRTITVRHMGPDLLCEIDSIELSGFFIDVKSAVAGGERYIDAQIKAAEEAAKDQQRRKRA